MSKAFPELSALKARDVAAWNEAWRHLWPMALQAARHPEARLLPWESEDVASEAILAVIEQIETVTSENHLKALTITIARRRAIELARRKSARKRTVPDECDPVMATSASWDEGDEIEQRELLGLLHRALQVLEPETRQILHDKFALGLTHEEISAHYGIPPGTSCTKVMRGIRKVQAHLQQSSLLREELRDYMR
ncbi:MAG: sigma-70 family RNA polymerase sigma factor [Verrucomicrobiales bacterium]|nr:sigma-70 family RNA polymerase sigma factor [Verrucomicrobiales bacterium]